MGVRLGCEKEDFVAHVEHCQSTNDISKRGLSETGSSFSCISRKCEGKKEKKALNSMRRHGCGNRTRETEPALTSGKRRKLKGRNNHERGGEISQRFVAQACSVKFFV